MNLCRRRFLHLAAGAAVLRTCVSAEAYPSRPVKIIVGQAAGSASDIVARLIAQFLSEKLGQQFLVEVRPGAAGNIATEAVTHMPPDGYTLLLVNSQNAINVALYEKLSFDFVRDIAPVGKVESVPLVMEVHPSVPVKTISEFIATLNQQTNAAVLDPNIKQRFADLGAVAVPPNSPDEFAKFIAENIDKWTKVIKFAGIKPQ